MAIQTYTNRALIVFKSISLTSSLTNIFQITTSLYENHFHVLFTRPGYNPQERKRFQKTHPEYDASDDLTFAKTNIAKHQEWILNGDKKVEDDQTTYPLEHNAYKTNGPTANGVCSDGANSNVEDESLEGSTNSAADAMSTTSGKKTDETQSNLETGADNNANPSDSDLIDDFFRT